MSVDNKILDNLGVVTVTTLVETQLMCGWQGFDAKNDNAFDGMIIMKRGRKSVKETGGIIFVQIKCGTTGGYKIVRKKDPENIGIHVGEEYIKSHRPRWNAVSSPSILIFVDADEYDFDKPNQYEPLMYWVDLKRDDSYCEDNKQIILVPIKNKISLKSKGELHNLCSPLISGKDLKTIYFKSKEALKINLNSSLKQEALEFYDLWKKQTCQHSKLGNIIISRKGWRHIARPNRATHRIIASWLLLPVAKQIIESVSEYQILNRSKVDVSQDVIIVEDYIGLNANVSFNYRDNSLVQVILVRKRIINKTEIALEKIWFYSVFEKRRGKEI